MAVCTICNLEMNGSASCVEDPLPLVDGEYPPIKWGQEEVFSGRSISHRCGDCDVLPDGVHHHGCHFEECPRCHGQLITCEHWDGRWPGDEA